MNQHGGEELWVSSTGDHVPCDLRKFPTSYGLFRTSPNRQNGKDFGKVTACYSHVIESWQQLHVSISANRIVDFVILVHATIDYSLRRGPYSIQSNTCIFPFSHGLKCAAERSSLYLEVVPLHIPTQGEYCRDCMFLLLYKIIALFCDHFQNLAGRRFVSLERFLHVVWKSIHLIRARKNPWD